MKTNNNQNKHLPLLIAGCSALLLASCATKIASDKNAPTGPPSATVKVEIVQAAYLASAQNGSGTLNYKGHQHAFTISGVGAGGTGVQNLSATGNVYNLHSLSGFPGTYTGARSGFTLFKGKMQAKLTNGNDVILYLTGSTTGLASSWGADKFVIKMKD